MADLLTEALAYAKRGWYVFPCREKPGEPFLREGETITPQEKTPYTSQGLNDATLDDEQITLWWTKFPNALIGVNAGKSGLFVVDIDKKHVNGLDTFTQWNINDTAGLHSITPSGGVHIIFTGNGKSSTNGKTGIDTRGEGGYFIVPPSRIIAGEHAGEYKSFDDWGRIPGSIPDGLMGNLFPNKTTEYVRGNSTLEKKLLSRATTTFMTDGAMPGGRNQALFNALCDFSGCGYSKDDAREILFPVSTRIGLDKSEFENTLHKAYSRNRTAAIPDSIQEKIAAGGKHVASKITFEEQTIIETALLACMLMDNSLIPIVNDILNVDDFQGMKNRIIFRSIIRTYTTGVKVDYLTVSNEVMKETDKISFDDISRMINIYVPETDNVLAYAYIIKEKASVRKLEALMDNKEKYFKGSLVETIAKLEGDISDIAMYGGVRSTNVLSAKQATELVAEQTRQIISGEIEQLKIGFVDYDYHIGGIYTNELVVLAARSGDGKSALSLSIANHVALTNQKPVVFFSLEMSTHESICRLICQLTGLPFKNVYHGKLKEDEWKVYREAMDRISTSPLYFDDTFGITVPELRSKIRKLMEKDVKLIIIDQLEQIKGYEGMPLYVQFDKIAYDIKNFTQEFNVPIILNHQLNRGITDRKLKNPEPMLQDLNQAGEKPANQVWVITHRKDERGKILQSKVKILKNRNGARIEFPVTFVGERMLFSNLAHGEDVEFDDENNLSNDEYQFEADEPSWAHK